MEPCASAGAAAAVATAATTTVASELAPVAKRQRVSAADMHLSTIPGDSDAVAAARRAAAVASASVPSSAASSAASSPGTGPAVAAAAAPVRELDAEPSFEALMKPSRLLPNKALAFSVLLSNPKSVETMITVVQSVLKDNVRLWLTQSPAFNGIAITSMDKSQTAMAIARLQCPVVLYADADGVVPEELPVTVPTPQMLIAFKTLEDIQQVAMYQELNSNTIFITMLDTSGLRKRRSISYVHDVETMDKIGNLRYSFEYKHPLKKLKDSVRAASDIKAPYITLTIREVNSQLRLLETFATDEAHSTTTDDTLPFAVCARDAATASASAGAGAGGHSSDGDGGRVEWLNVLQGNEFAKFVDCGAPDAPTTNNVASGSAKILSMIPVTDDKVRPLKTLVQADFCVKKLHEMLKNLKDDTDVTLFFSQDVPLIIKFPLVSKQPSCFVAFVLAPYLKSDDDVETSSTRGGAGGGSGVEH